MNHADVAEIFDYVVVGGGSAGAVVAHRLAEDGVTNVCLIEAGPRDKNLFIHVPAGFIKLLFNARYTWQFKSEPNPATANRHIRLTQGKTLGGSSSVNGLACVRGHPQDFDAWANDGNFGWSFADVLPYFKRSERRIGPGEERYRGRHGPLPITDSDWHHPLCDAFIEGAASLGIPENSDYNGNSQFGAGYYQRWIENGWRFSTAKAYLGHARPKLLEIRTEAQVTEILLEGNTAVGIRYRHNSNAQQRVVRARAEVILCAGAINTPKLLQLSGIGPPEFLADVGIPTKHELPGVGANLHDHYVIRTVARVSGVDTLNSRARWPRLGIEIARWLGGSPSALGIGPAAACAFCNSEDISGRPDLQFFITPGSFVESIPGLLDSFPGITAGCYQLRPESRGYLRLRSKDPFADPIVDPNWLTHPTDTRTVVAGVRLARKMLTTKPLQRFNCTETSPGAQVLSDEDILAFVRQRGNTAYHFVGTCKMGPAGDAMAVVDDQLRVRGVGRLRVADASIMPSITSANTGAAAIMIGEKASDLIRGKHLPMETL